MYRIVCRQIRIWHRDAPASTEPGLEAFVMLQGRICLSLLRVLIGFDGCFIDLSENRMAGSRTSSSCVSASLLREQCLTSRAA